MRSTIQTARAHHSSFPVFPADDADQKKTNQTNPASTQLTFFSGEDVILARQPMPDLIEELREMRVHVRHTVYLIGITKSRYQIMTRNALELVANFLSI